MACPPGRPLQPPQRAASRASHLVVDVLEEPFELGAALCPVALGLVARFQQQGVLPVKRIEALLVQRLHLGFGGSAGRCSAAQGGPAAGRPRRRGWCPATHSGGSGKACRRPWLHLLRFSKPFPEFPHIHVHRDVPSFKGAVPFGPSAFACSLSSNGTRMFTLCGAGFAL